MHSQIESVFLGGLSAVFAGYGLWELGLAYRTAALQAWSDRAIPGAAGILVAAVFAVMTLRVLGGLHHDHRFIESPSFHRHDPGSLPGRGVRYLHRLDPAPARHAARGTKPDRSAA
jgi:hypothetical protein